MDKKAKKSQNVCLTTKGENMFGSTGIPRQERSGSLTSELFMGGLGLVFNDGNQRTNKKKKRTPQRNTKGEKPGGETNNQRWT